MITLNDIFQLLKFIFQLNYPNENFQLFKQKLQQMSSLVESKDSFKMYVTFFLALNEPAECCNIRMSTPNSIHLLHTKGFQTKLPLPQLNSKNEHPNDSLLCVLFDSTVLNAIQMNCVFQQKRQNYVFATETVDRLARDSKHE